MATKKPYENEITLTGQNQPLKCWQPLKILTHFIKGLDLLAKGQQSCRPSNFENDSTSGKLEPGPNALAYNSAVMAEAADFFLRTSTLTTSNFEAP